MKKKSIILIIYMALGCATQNDEKNADSINNMNVDTNDTNLLENSQKSTNNNSNNTKENNLIENTDKNLSTNKKNFNANNITKDTTSTASKKTGVDETKKEKSKITWLGFDYNEMGSKIEIFTQGSPEFEITENKKNGIYSLVAIKYLNCNIAKRWLRGIDASEFSSPVSYIKATQNKDDVEILIVLRIPEKYSLFAENGNLIVRFEEKSNLAEIRPDKESIASAEIISDLPTLMKIEKGSQMPKNYYPTAPKMQPIAKNNDENSLQGNKSNKNQAQDELNESTENNNTKTLANEENENINNSIDSGNENISGNEENINSNEENINDIKENIDDSSDDENNKNSSNNNTNGEQNAQHGKLFFYAMVGADTSSDDFSNPEENTQTEEENVSDEDSSQEASNVKNNQKDKSNKNSTEIVGQEKPVEAIESSFKPISIEFKGAQLTDVIEALSKESGINFIYPDSVGRQAVNLSLKNVPWDQALQALLETNGLGMSNIKGNVIRIDTLDNLDSERKKLENVRKSAIVITPTKVLVVRLSYSKATTLKELVKEMLPSAKFDTRVKVQVDDRTNSLIIEAIPEDLGKIKALIERLDLQTPQVKIATRIIEILNENQADFGINWLSPFRTDQSPGLGIGSLNFPKNINAGFAVDTGISPNSTEGKTSFDFHFGSIDNSIELDLRLRMSELQKISRSLQNNSVLVLDNNKANIVAGRSDFFMAAGANGAGQLVPVDFNLSLDVTPHITADGAVQMEIEVKNESPIKTVGAAQASKNTRNLKTSMLRNSGETAVIGGLYTIDDSDSKLGVPYLSNLPLLGALFRAKSSTKSKRELVIMVTPTILTFDKNNGEKDLSNISENSTQNETNSLSNQSAFNSQNNGNNNSGNNSNENDNSSSNENDNSSSNENNNSSSNENAGFAMDSNNSNDTQNNSEENF